MYLAIEIGILLGLTETLFVIHRLSRVSATELFWLIVYASLIYTLIALFLSIPFHKHKSSLRTRRLLIVVIAILTIFTLFSAIWPFSYTRIPTTDPSKLNVLLISVDTLRRDHLGCYGYKQARTPNIDQLASESILFEDATSPIPLTGPSHVTMLTGNYPITHGVMVNGARINDSAKTLPELLHNAGYRTAAFVSGWTLKNEAVGLANRFDRYDDELSPYFFLPDIVFQLVIPRAISKVSEKFWGCRLIPLERAGDRTTHNAIHWITKKDDHPFFAMVHYFDPHGPHKNRKGIQTVKAYDDEIANTDQQIGDLLKKIPQKTIVVFTADHGESLTEHGYFFDHGEFLYDTCARVPLMIRFPDRSKAGTRISAPAGLVDLAPTILHLAGLSENPKTEGVDLLSGAKTRAMFGCIRQGIREARRARYSIRESGYKLILNFDFRMTKPAYAELYDLKNDPNEEKNLASTVPEIQPELRKKLQQWMSKDLHKQTVPDQNIQDELRSLGYL
jgi:choline-sulfatase